MKAYTDEDIVQLLGEECVRKVGGSASVEAAAPLDTAGPRDITYSASATNWLRSKAGITLIPVMSDDQLVNSDTVVLQTRNPRLAFIRVISKLFDRPPLPGIHPTAIICSSSLIGKNVHVGPYTIIGEKCQVGSDSIIYGHVHLCSNVFLGERVIVHSGTVIGSEGFGFERNERSAYERFPHLGGVHIEDDVRIGANNTIDRGTMGLTLLRRGVKTDNQCHIAHNVVIGEDTALAACTMIAGSVRVGDQTWIGPGTSIRDKMTIGARVTIGVGSVVVKDVQDGMTVAGVPARSLLGRN